MRLQLRLDPVRAENNQMALPIPADRAMLTPNCVEQALAFGVNLLTRNRLEPAARC